jgi:thymidylate synthase
MRMMEPNFTVAIGKAAEKLRDHSFPVNTGHWQGVDIKNKPEMLTYEVLNHTVQVPLPHAQDPKYISLDRYRDDIKPNLPWADDHFEERVCGQPLNPGETWKTWPYNKSADTFRDLDDPFIKETDWAYLAALIDGDGCILNRGDGRISIVIDQVDHPFMVRLRDKYLIGQKLRDQNINNKLSDRTQTRWQISQRDEVKWVLSHVMKYLELKRHEAVKAFDELPDFDRRLVGDKGREPIFNHNYMQRYWPQYAGMSAGGFINDQILGRYGLDPREGIYHRYGDLNDVVELLCKEPYTRQAYLPVFFPEDTGAVHGGRIPCSLGYHFIRRGDHCHIIYYLRSCDFVRHFRDDIYLTLRLLLWVIEQTAKRDARWENVMPGIFTMHITSLHLFKNDYIAQFGKVPPR